MSVALPRFAKPLDRQTHNRYLQAYRRWACDQKAKGMPVPCWCLYVWIAGNWKSRMNIAERPMVRPSWSTKAQWAGWNLHKRNGGELSFSEYLAKREKRSIAGQGRRSDMVGGGKRRRNAVRPVEGLDDEEDVSLPAEPPTPPQLSKQAVVARDEGLRMEPASVVAKINRLLAAQGIAPKQVDA